MYRIEFSKRAAADLASLDRTLQIRVLKKLEAAAADPARFFMPLKGVRGFRMRVGDLRVLADLLPDDEVVLVARIGPREHIYD